MLISRCPNLEELSLDGYTTNPIESHRLVCGRWPNLRKLTLGDVIVNLDLGPGPAAGTGGDEKPLSIQFLEAHSNLQTLQISQHALLPRHLSFLSTSSLAHLVKFTGSLEQLQSLAPAQVLPNSRGVSLSHQLQSLAFHEPILLRDVTPVVISSALQGLGNLTMLRIGFLLHSNLLHESGSLLRSITASCPRLERIELGCACGPSFTIVCFHFVRAIYVVHKLSNTIFCFCRNHSPKRYSTSEDYALSP
jgi:hypothetical protein